MATVEGIQKTFLSSPYFAVVGASKDQKKFGTRVLKWYQARDLSVTPVHPVRLMLFFFSFLFHLLPARVSFADTYNL